MEAILTIEMPKNCGLCPISNNWLENGEQKGFCPVKNADCNFNERPSWCPLKPMPHKLQADWYTDGYKEGFNACLEDITGETE